MSMDVLQSGGGRTALRSPASNNSNLTSITAGVSLGVGLDVTDAGLVTHATYPPDNNNSITVTDNATISPVASVMLISAAAARTGLIIAPPNPRKTGAVVTVINRSAFNHTFAARTTSFVADGGNQRLLSYSSQVFTWVDPDAMWFPSATK